MKRPEETTSAEFLAMTPSQRLDWRDALFNAWSHGQWSAIQVETQADHDDSITNQEWTI